MGQSRFSPYNLRRCSVSTLKAPDKALVDVIAGQCSKAAPKVYRLIAETIRHDYGDAVIGVLLYGSCLRGADVENNIVDIYVIVDDYGNVYDKKREARLNAWLPPNVFYQEITADGALVRIKSAIITLDDFNDGVSHWFHSYLWGRFSQPVRMLYVRDDTIRSQINAALAQAVLSLLRATLPALGATCADVEAIWSQALCLSYSAEYRPESQSRAGQLIKLNMAYYHQLTLAALPMLGSLLQREGDVYVCLADGRARGKALLQWRLRRWQGRLLSILRLMKASFTFKNSVDYAAWKINKHTGVMIDVTPALRRYPLLFGWRVLWQLARRGILH